MVALMMRAKCLGHITGFFEICSRKDAQDAGSRGVWVCIGKGVENRISVTEIFREDERKCIIKINGEVTATPVTQSVVNQYIDDWKSLFAFVGRARSADLLDEIRAYSQKLNTFTCEIGYHGLRILEVSDEA